MQLDYNVLCIQAMFPISTRFIAKEKNEASFYNVKFPFSYAEIIKKCIALIFPFPFRIGNGPEKAP